MKKIAVIDYGMGNLRSVHKAIEHVAPGIKVSVTSEPDDIRRADSVVFPGQGAITGCLAALDARGLREALIEAIKTKPFLGICLGLQALYDFSEEGGGTPGLGVLAGKVRLFPAEAARDAPGGRALKVPHMGWNHVHQVVRHPLWHGVAQDERFYFVHSYYVESADERYVAGVTHYGVRFTAAATRQNIFAMQCHPEKSQDAGLRLLQNFARWDGAE
jgi:glutamine amidotransferase